jgi:hypothetical protein
MATHVAIDTFAAKLVENRVRINRGRGQTGVPVNAAEAFSRFGCPLFKCTMQAFCVGVNKTLIMARHQHTCISKLTLAA